MRHFTCEPDEIDRIEYKLYSCVKTLTMYAGCACVGTLGIKAERDDYEVLRKTRKRENDCQYVNELNFDISTYLALLNHLLRTSLE